MIIESTFKPLWWLKNPHMQTLYPKLIDLQKMELTYTKERIELTDGDFIDLVWSNHHLPHHSPLVILLHGLGGGLHSHYVQSLFSSLNAQGIRCVMMYFRGASDEPNRFIRAYHAGDTQDFSYLLEILKKREPHTKKAAIGVSLGGNALLKWLGETSAQSFIECAIAISVPFQLSTTTHKLQHGFSKVYQTHLLKRLKQMLKLKMQKNHLEHVITSIQLNQIKNLWEFDNQITAPIHGFKNADDYYNSASCKTYLTSIKTPTLIIHAEDDPFMTPDVIPKSNELSCDVTLELSPHGGHVGFVSANKKGAPYLWLKDRIPYFLKQNDLFK